MRVHRGMGDWVLGYGSPVPINYPAGTQPWAYNPDPVSTPQWSRAAIINFIATRFAENPNLFDQYNGQTLTVLGVTFGVLNGALNFDAPEW